VIPAPERNAERPTCAEIIETRIEQVMHESWSGVGSVSFPDVSTLDSWNRLPVRQILGGSYAVYDMTLGFGKVIDHLHLKGCGKSHFDPTSG
jgi:acetoacetate decarboxylase